MKEKKQLKSISGSREETNSEKEVRKKAFEQFQKENKELLQQRGIDFSAFANRRMLYEVYKKYAQGKREFDNLEERELFEKIEDLLNTYKGDFAD